tara:strand:+ start:620 stop:1531 length:912 start_codon:yes stop_codon:yes gene_type:complete
MSRVISDPVKDGEVGTAADLNARFDAYTMTDLNAFNARNAAYDLPQMDQSPAFYALNGQKDDLGKVDFFHAAPVVANGQGTLPNAGHLIEDGAGTPTVAAYPAGIPITANDVLRVYWNLSVHPKFTGTPWTVGTSLSHYIFDAILGATIPIATNATCWVLYLEWDITDNTLTNWTTVPLQGDFTTAVAGYFGEALPTTMATSVVPCWITYVNSTVDREVAGPEYGVDVGWRGVSGCYYVDFASAGGATTVYGLRLRLKGPMHPLSNAGTNYLVHDLDVMDQAQTNVQLEYTSGRISVLRHRLG